LQKLYQYAADVKSAVALFQEAGVEIESMTVADAATAAEIWLSLPHLSLADRTCLALARRLGGVAITADSGWSGVDGIGVDVIR